MLSNPRKNTTLLLRTAKNTGILKFCVLCPPPPAAEWVQSNCDEYMSVCPLAYLRNHTAYLTSIFVHVACGHAMARSSAGVAICYALPVLRIIDVMFPSDGIYLLNDKNQQV